MPIEVEQPTLKTSMEAEAAEAFKKLPPLEVVDGDLYSAQFLGPCTIATLCLSKYDIDLHD